MDWHVKSELKFEQDESKHYYDFNLTNITVVIPNQALCSIKDPNIPLILYSML